MRACLRCRPRARVDACAITFRAGDALMISRKDHTRMADTEQAMRELGDASARVVGSLMNAY